MPQKIISIVGPTATGKTKLALQLAEKLVTDEAINGVDIISADSRQVYRGLEILSGADVPSGFVPIKGDTPELTYFTNADASIHLLGLQIIDPDQEWSVAHFQLLGRDSIKRARTANRSVIVVGGTGLYHRYLFDEDPTLHIPPNEALRVELEALSVSELQGRLRTLSEQKFNSMNQSDVANPRRLIRAIEIAVFKKSSDAQTKVEVLKKNVAIEKTVIGLTDELPQIEQKIADRVSERFEQGAQQEVKALMNTYSDWSVPAFSATGVKEIKDFLENKISEEECLKLWALSEFQYAKRQLTWWKRETNVKWFSANEADVLETVFSYIQTDK